MKRLVLVAVLAAALLVLFAGTALADGPWGYAGNYGYGNMGYGGGYNSGYMGGGYGGMYGGYYPYMPYNCCCYVYCCNNYTPPKQTYYPHKMRGGYGQMGYGGGYGMNAGYGW